MKNTTTKLYLGDCLSVLKALPPNSVHCAVTSPPYWNLRDYGHADQIGMEDTLEEFLAKLVAVFEEVKRVLHPSGSLWVQMGDSYNSALTRGSFGDQSKHGYTDHGAKRQTVKKLHAKNRLGQPHRLVLALQDAGWIWRDEIIWRKPNPMPASFDDRTTPAHEFIHVLTKKPHYYFDSWAIREPAAQPNRVRNDKVGGNKGDLVHHSPGGIFQGSDTRAARSVWDIVTEGYEDAHFATFPTELPKRCILAATSEKGLCPITLKPWRRIFEKTGVTEHGGKRKRADAPGAEVSASSVFRTGIITVKEPVGWEPTCACCDQEDEDKDNTIPATVLDMFSGSGTTGVAAVRAFRNYVGIECNPQYLQLSVKRIGEEMRLFNTIEVVNASNEPLTVAPF